ncbi:3-oxoadipate enol-lactonase [Aquicoccus sp. SCR17]|nr:3-oxoadipate enol-lactonase [Carideicomes alvinocaridis]
MPKVRLGEVTLNYLEGGDPAGAPVVFAHALGTDLRLWEDVWPLLPAGLRLIAWDSRGHGGSDAPPPPYAMGALVRDAEALLDHLEVRDAVFVGLSLGGLVAQGLAVKRLDQLRALVLSNTAAKIGTKQMWEARAQAITEKGLGPQVAGMLERWFTPRFRHSPAATTWRARLAAQPPHGIAGCCSAIAGTDFYTPTSGLRLPVLAIASSDDPATPADLVRETAALIPGAKMELIRRAAHLPPVEQPAAFAGLLTTFLKQTGHI